jgi:large subunit ribosomal protein L4
MGTTPVFDVTGAQTREMELPESLFGAGPHAVVLHQVVLAELAAKRQGTASTKTRSEVAGSNRKLWRQKGTGRARVGDRRPPSRVGGGRVTGPRPRDYRQRTAKALKDLALRSALEARAAAGAIMFVEPFELTEAKTKALVGVVEALGGTRGALLVLGKPDEIIVRCGRNIPDFAVSNAAKVSTYELMSARRIIIATDALAQLEARVS